MSEALAETAVAAAPVVEAATIDELMDGGTAAADAFFARTADKATVPSTIPRR